MPNSRLSSGLAPLVPYGAGGGALVYAFVMVIFAFLRQSRLKGMMEKAVSKFCTL